MLKIQNLSQLLNGSLKLDSGDSLDLSNGLMRTGSFSLVSGGDIIATNTNIYAKSNEVVNKIISENGGVDISSSSIFAKGGLTIDAVQNIVGNQTNIQTSNNKALLIKSSEANIAFNNANLNSGLISINASGNLGLNNSNVVAKADETLTRSLASKLNLDVTGAGSIMLSSGENLSLDNSNLQSKYKNNISAGLNLSANGLILNTTKNGEVNINSFGNSILNGTNISGGSQNIDAGGNLSANNSVFASSKNKDLNIDAGGSLTFDNGSASGRGVSISSSSNLSLQNSQVTSLLKDITISSSNGKIDFSNSNINSSAGG